MLNKIRDYLDFAGLQYRNPDKAGEEREKMLELRHKGQEARKAFTELAKAFQASHPEWQLQQTSQWMNQAQRLRPHFWIYLQRDGQVTEPMMALRLYGTSTGFGISKTLACLPRVCSSFLRSIKLTSSETPKSEGFPYKRKASIGSVTCPSLCR